MPTEQQVIQQYSEAEKTAYLSVIASLASADREASAQEVEVLQQLAHAAGLSEQAAQRVVAAAQESNNQSIQQNLEALRNSELRFSLVTDLISFARADGNYAANEEQMINKMANYLGVNQQQVQTLETAVDQSVAHPQAETQSSSLFGGIGDKLRQVGIPPETALTGLLTVLAPMVLSRVMGGNNRNTSGYGGNLGGMSSGGMGGGLGGALGGLLGSGAMSGVLGQVLGGGGANTSAPMGGLGGLGGGLGTLMTVLGGMGGRPQAAPRTAGGGGLGGLLGGMGGGGGSMGGGLGGLLGGLLGGR